VQQAEAGVQVAEATIQSAQARISQAEAGVGRAEGAYQRWSSESERIRELAANSSVTTKLADETLSQFRAAEASRSESIARVETATAERNEAQANAAKSRADLVAANAQLRVAQASLKQTTTMLGYAEVKAPFDGVITRRSVDTGHYVYPASGGSTQPMLVIASIDRVRIFVDVPELEASLVDVGDPAVVRLPSHLGGELAATVTRSSWSLSQANHSIRTEIDIPNEQGLLRPGMYTSVSIRLDERSDVLALPITAILRDGQATYCYCVEADQLVRKAIALGLRSGSEVEVVSGLSGSESVVLAQAESLQPGQRVEVMQPAK
jgi:RND family efflux transporter MFP subunit